jgi:ABC-2 type transport system ATP-binding protein
LNEFAIEAKKIRKSFKKFLAVDDIDLSIRTQTVHGFLGPNGAGKTTVIRILLGLLPPDNAEIMVLGQDLFLHREEIMRQVGAIVETPVFFEFLTAYENLFYLANMSGPVTDRKIHETLEIVGLEHVANKKVGEFSLGMKQRLGIAQALLPDNRLIFLDEPVNGLDPHGIVDVRNLIRHLCRDHGVTVFLSSHLLVEVEYICDYVSIINKGRKICESKVSDLLAKDSLIELRTTDVEAFRRFAGERNLPILSVSPDPESPDGVSRIVFESVEIPVPGLVSALVGSGIPVYQAAKHRKNLEEIFVELTSAD